MDNKQQMSRGSGAKGSVRGIKRHDRKRSANWDLWEQMPHCKLWEVVALSLGIEPPKYSHEVRGWPTEYQRRLVIATAHIESGTLIRSKADSEGVELLVFAGWAQSLGWELPESFPQSAVQQTFIPVTKVGSAGKISSNVEAIPGKMPKVVIGKLAIKAAWQIECEKGKRATAKEVIEKLQSWVDSKDNPDAEVALTKIFSHGVVWVTNAGKSKSYDIGACQKALENWHKSRT